MAAAEAGEEDLAGRGGMAGVGMEVASVTDRGSGSGGVDERAFGRSPLDFVYRVSAVAGQDRTTETYIVPVDLGAQALVRPPGKL